MMMKRVAAAKKNNLIEKYRPYLIPITAFGALALIVVILIVQATATSITLSKLADQSSKSGESIDAIIQTLLIETKYTNDLRSQVGLSEITYPIEKLLDSGANREADSSANLSYFKAIDTLYNAEIEEKQRAAFRSLLDGVDFQAFLKANKLSIKSKTKLGAGIMKGNVEYFDVLFSGDTSLLTVTSFVGEKTEMASFDKETVDTLAIAVKAIDAHVALLDGTLVKLLKIKDDAGILAALKEKECVMQFDSETGDSYSMAIAKNKDVFFRFGVDKKTIEYFTGSGLKYKTYDDFRDALAREVKAIDTRGDSEKKLDAIKKEILSLSNDKAFKTLMDSKKLKLSTTPRSDYYFLYYDVTDTSGRRIGSIAIDKFHFTAYLMDKDDVQISSLKALVESGSDDVKKN